MARDFVKRPIEEVLWQFVTDLTETTDENGGIAWKGLCPFHPDTNPSFHAYYNGDPDHSWCCCWACWQDGGDIIDFIIKYQKEIWHKDITFKEALVLVADPLTAEQTMERELAKMLAEVPSPDLIDLSIRQHNLLQQMPTEAAHRLCYTIDLAITEHDISFAHDTLRRFNV